MSYYNAALNNSRGESYDSEGMVIKCVIDASDSGSLSGHVEGEAVAWGRPSVNSFTCSGVRVWQRKWFDVSGYRTAGHASGGRIAV